MEEPPRALRWKTYKSGEKTDGGTSRGGQVKVLGKKAQQIEDGA